VDKKYVQHAAYTLDIDLPTTGILSSLILRVHALTTTTGLAPCPWIKYLISSVSVNQAGQAALNATRPEVFQADYYYKTGKFPRRGFNPLTSTATEVIEDIPILFGEKLVDLDHTIDLSRLNDPKLSVTYDTAATDCAGKVIWDTAEYPKFDVIAHLIEGAGVPMSKGYHSLRQIESYTPANSEKRYVELKGGRPVKRLYTQLDISQPYFGTRHSVDKVKLWGDNEAWVPLDLEVEDWYKTVKDVYGLCDVEGIVYYAKGGGRLDTCVDGVTHLAAEAPFEGLHILRAQRGSARDAALVQILISGGELTNDVITASYHFRGIAPWTVMPVDMDKMLGMEYLDPKEHAPVFLEIDHSSGAAGIGGPMRIHIEDLVTTY